MSIVFNGIAILSLVVGATEPNVVAKSESKCDFHHITDEKIHLTNLSPYWAQELVGAELAKDAMDQLKLTTPLKTVTVVNIDGGINKADVRADLVGRAATKVNAFGSAADHGSSVLNVLAGRGRFGVGHANYVKISDVITNDYKPSATAGGLSFGLDAMLGNTNPEDAALNQANEAYTAAYNQAMAEFPSEAAMTKSSEESLPAPNSDLASQRGAAYARLADRAGVILRKTNPTAADRLDAIDDEGRRQYNIVFGGRFDELDASLKRSNGDVVSLEMHTLSALHSDRNQTLNQTLDAVSKRSIIVACAGNNYGQDGAAGKALLKNQNVIIVGSLHPTGLTSDFSSASRDASIMAPSDIWQYSPNPKMGDRFSGTSGAQPVVSGALANAPAILKPVTAAEARRLLERTMVPLHYEEGSRGMVNAYRLVAYAARLKRAGWPKDKSKLLADETLADFHQAAEQKLVEARRQLAYPSCAIKETALRAFRQAFLLNPTAATASEIKKLYRMSMFPHDGFFYELYAADPNERKRIAAEIASHAGPQNPAIPTSLIQRNATFFDQSDAAK